MVIAEMAPRQTFKLLDLPDAALSAIIAGLTASDKKMIMAACRRTFDMTMLNTDITVKVAEGSKFADFKKVLSLAFPVSIHLVITDLASKSKTLDALPHVPLSTMAVLMGMVPDNTLLQSAASCQDKAWQRITKVTIKGKLMSCLVLRFIALTCPQLVQLKIERPSYWAEQTYMFNSNPEAALPLTLCASLKCLEVDDYRPNLPSSYHSPAELHHNLPNIDTLIFTKRHNASLIQAFATQLTCLEIHYDADKMDEIQQLVRPLSNLQHLCVPELVLPDSIENLKVLKLSSYVTDDHMQLLLQLPSLIELHLPDLCDIFEDWSHHACPWQELHLDNLRFDGLNYLNLSSLKKMSVESDVAIYLPDPSVTNSLPVVQHVITSLSHTQLEVGWGEIKQRVHFGKPNAMRWDIRDCGSEHEQNAAELIRVAAQRIGPCKVCNCEALIRRPLPLAAVLKWGQAFIEPVCLGRNYDPQAFVWHALQKLEKLHTVVFWTHPRFGHDPRKPGDDAELLNIPSAIHSAAHNYVVPANKSLRIEHGFSSSTLKRGAVTEAGLLLRTAIIEVLPAGCKLASFQYACMDDNDHYSYCGLVNAYWVAVVEPIRGTEYAAELYVPDQLVVTD